MAHASYIITLDSVKNFVDTACNRIIISKDFLVIRPACILQMIISSCSAPADLLCVVGYIAGLRQSVENRVQRPFQHRVYTIAFFCKSLCNLIAVKIFLTKQIKYQHFRCSTLEIVNCLPHKITIFDIFDILSHYTFIVNTFPVNILLTN